MEKFRTHTGEIVTGERLQAALDKVADGAVQLAHDIRKEDAYGPHITESQKDEYLLGGLAYAQKVRRGEAYDFTTLQRINQELTGECIGFLQPYGRAGNVT